jgi:nitroreductase
VSSASTYNALMQFRDLVETRVSVRQFASDVVLPEHVRDMVRLAGLAPSPNNSQPWQFVAVTRPELLKQMGEAVHRRLGALLPEPQTDEGRHARQRVEWFSTFFADAPLVIGIVLMPYEAVIETALESSRVTGAQVNAMRGQPDVQALGAAVEHLLLAAADLGYGGCWLSGPLVAREALERLLDIKAPGRLAAMVAIGKPANATPSHRERKALDEILRIID